jgi:hypothetical protein
VNKGFRPQKDKGYWAVSLLVMAIWLIGIGGCKENRNLEDSVYISLKARWLLGEPCSPPCWENIEPGVTQPEEVTGLLKASPGIDPASVKVKTIPNDEYGLTFWTFSDAMGPWVGNIGYFLQQDSITAIKLTVPDLCLHEILSAYGEPDYLLSPTVFKTSGEVSLIWEKHGFLYETKVSSPGEPITADVCGGGLTLFPVGTPFDSIPSHYEFSLDRAVVPWTGYGHYGD